jgi:DNA-binding response OmpR family regulator
LPQAGKIDSRGYIAVTRILSLDDEPEMVALMGLILRRAGYDYIGATNNHEAWSILRREPIDLFTEDLMRPGMDGWEFYQQMRTDDRLCRIPVIIVTARSRCMDQLLGLPIADVDDYVTKPFSPQELLSSVERVLLEHSKPLPTEQERERGRQEAAAFVTSRAQMSQEMTQRCIELLDEIAAGLPNVLRDGHAVLIYGQRGCYRISLDTGHVLRLPNRPVCIVPQSCWLSDPNVCLPFEEAGANVQRIVGAVLMLSADQDIQDETILRQLR